MILPVVLVAADQAEAGNVGAHFAQPDERLGADRAIKELDLAQPLAVVPHLQQHSLHLLGAPEVVQGHARHELEPQFHRLDHCYVRGFVLVSEVQPCPE